MCRACHSRNLSWEQSAGTGVVYAWSLVWRPQTPHFTVPYAPVIVTLDEGFRMLSNLIGCESDAVATGMRVEVTFAPIGGGIHLPYFRPVADGRQH